MASEPPFCPFCNSVLPPLAAPLTSAKRACPRCGEPVAASRWPIDPALPSLAEPPIAIQREKGPGVHTTAFALMGLMLVMALIGLVFALSTQDLRRSRDPKVLFKPRKPLELSGLGYLPLGCQVVAGLQIAEMTDDTEKLGKELLAEPRPAILDWLVRQILRPSGLKLEQIDHLVLSPVLQPSSPRVVMIVKTRPESPLRAENIHESIRSRKSKHDDHWLYKIPLQPIGEALLWPIDDHTLVYVLAAEAVKLEYLAGLSQTPRPVKDVLAKPVYEVLADRLPKQNLVWAAGQTEPLFALTPALLLMPDGAARMKQMESLKEVKTFALGLEPSADFLTLMGHFNLNSAAATGPFKQLLEGTAIEGAKRQLALATPADEKEQWVLWQVRMDVAAVRSLVSFGKQGQK